jgi:DNA anti-recombination protein RmuC
MLSFTYILHAYTDLPHTLIPCILEATMTEDQFKRLLEENNTRLLEHVGARLDERLEQNNDQLLTRLDKRFDERLEQNNAVLFGQVSQYFDRRFDSLHDELKADTNRIYNAIDGIAKRLTTDEQERAAINGEQNRQNGWISQLAKATNTKLVPEQ